PHLNVFKLKQPGMNRADDPFAVALSVWGQLGSIDRFELAQVILQAANLLGVSRRRVVLQLVVILVETGAGGLAGVEGKIKIKVLVDQGVEIRDWFSFRGQRQRAGETQ